MLVLGVTDGISCGAAVVRDGIILAAVNEERLSRVKMAYGFPRQSIDETLRIAGVSSREIDLVMVATVNNYFFDGLRPFDGWLERDKGVIRNTIFGAAGRLGYLVDVVPSLESLYYGMRRPVFARRRSTIQRILRDEFDIHASVEFVGHHLSHAVSAYFTSGFDDALIVTMDGGGDGASSHVYRARNGHFERTGYTSAFNSLANYYSYVTHLCGFKAQKHEGKITGLAAHGRPIYKELLNDFICMRDGAIHNAGRVVFLGAIEALRKRLPAGWTHEDLAASVQSHCEDVALAYVSQHLNADSPTDVAMAGGLFANVRINQKVYELPGVRQLFVHPGMTDSGLAVGAALTPCLCNRSGSPMYCNHSVIRDVYYGPKYDAREIERELDNSGLQYSRPGSIAHEVANLLAEGYVVARFDGRMEYGPRALGNRSILYHPGDPSVNDWLNERLKRTEFMPFAPVTLIEEARKSYYNYENAKETARFMTITFDCTQWMRENCSGVVHVDGTARPQLLAPEDNPGYSKIIDEFRKLTGIPTLINTSFNMHEEPIVCSPQDAIRAFRMGHLDYLVIGEFLVPSPEPIQRDLSWAQTQTRLGVGTAN